MTPGIDMSAGPPGPGGANALPVDGSGRPLVISLTEEDATDIEQTGGKAAALAKATRCGLSALPGVVLTTAYTDAVDRAEYELADRARRAVFALADGDTNTLVARSSGVAEDSTESSMAGQFESVLNIDGYDAFVEGVRTVVDSRGRAGDADQALAVLVQPMIEPRFGGIMFGVDPVTGRTDRRVVAAVEGGPDPLVSGKVDGSRFLLDPKGKLVSKDLSDGPDLPKNVLSKLNELADRARGVFGGPQDVEWAIDERKNVLMLQSRPVTTELRGVPSGPLFGPGPVAETFPEPLRELEVDMWVPPLRDAVIEAVRLSGADITDLDDREAVVELCGHVAIDLELAGEIPTGKRGVLAALDVRPKIRRLGSAWRVGRLRSALPDLVDHLLDRSDADLECVPHPEQLSSRQLLAILRRGQVALRSLHSHEILMGMLAGDSANRLTGAGVALRVLTEARRDGFSDAEIISHSPVVLALTAPKVTGIIELPPPSNTGDQIAGSGSDAADNGIRREALRLRVRWTQEVMARAAWQLGERFTEAGALSSPEVIRDFRLSDVESFVTKRGVTAVSLITAHEHDFGSPLPARFQISDTGQAVADLSQDLCGGTGAGGGTATGPVTYDAENPTEGSVLVTTTLRPGLGPLLPRLAGIVAETGSVISHLAILAREQSVATVVAYQGATVDLIEGDIVEVDGTTGQVTVIDSVAERTPATEGATS